MGREQPRPADLHPLGVSQVPISARVSSEVSEMVPNQEFLVWA
jgi:Na+-transporting methylmalonyl-CoA/oxaloacetate decarboxylase beta subunit